MSIVSYTYSSYRFHLLKMKRVQQQTLFDVIEMPFLADRVELIIRRCYFELQKGMKDSKKTEKKQK